MVQVYGTGQELKHQEAPVSRLLTLQKQEVIPPNSAIKIPAEL
jgi:hypothetical protein